MNLNGLSIHNILVSNSVRRWVCTTTCRRVFMLQYLEDGDVLSGRSPKVVGNCCDNCVRDSRAATAASHAASSSSSATSQTSSSEVPPKRDLGLELAQALEVLHRFSGPMLCVSVPMLADILAGSKSAAVKKVAQTFDQTAVVGIGSGHKSSWWHDFIMGPICDAGLLYPKATRPDVYLPTSAAASYRYRNAHAA